MDGVDGGRGFLGAKRWHSPAPFAFYSFVIVAVLLGRLASVFFFIGYTVTMFYAFQINFIFQMHCVLCCVGTSVGVLGVRLGWVWRK